MRTHTFTVQLIGTGLVAACAACSVDAGMVINVGFNAQNTTVQLGQQFVIDIVADLPLDIVGWGLEFRVGDPAVIDLQGPPLAALPWNPTMITMFPDHWQFGGLAFPDPVSGQAVPLATLVFLATALGESDLILTIDHNDPTQGFVAGPSGPPGHFGSVQLNLGHVTVVPAPAASALLGAFVLRAAGSGRRRK